MSLDYGIGKLVWYYSIINRYLMELSGKVELHLMIRTYVH